MKRSILNVAMLLMGVVLGLLSPARLPLSKGTNDPVSTTAAHPTLESVRALASLVTTRVTVSDVQLTQLQGYTGGAKLFFISQVIRRGDANADPFSLAERGEC